MSEQGSPSPRSVSQTVADISAMCGEGRDAVEGAWHEATMYAERSVCKARSAIEDYFEIDKDFRMIGPKQEDPNLVRDVHDVFNLFALIPVIGLNLVNWSFESWWNIMFHGAAWTSLQDMWQGQVGGLFWYVSLAYFLLDLTFVVFFPTSVKSPSVIIVHHMVTIICLLVPKVHPEYLWVMGACMFVELNTWFLIARRSCNKRGEKPFVAGASFAKSCRMLTISLCFYSSWFSIRLALNGFLLPEIFKLWIAHSQRCGSMLNLTLISVFSQLALVILNTKWTIDLMRSKLKSKAPSKGL